MHTPAPTYRPLVPPRENSRRIAECDGYGCPHTSGVRYCSCGPNATHPCRPTACTERAMPAPSPSTANYKLLTPNWIYSFSSKERDTETGLSYFGSRYYSSDLSIWLSVDPMSDKYASLSPYNYCADNPVKLTDPDGRWIPGLDDDNNIIVTQEEGDDINSFKKFMGPAYSDEEIQKMFGEMQDGKINLTTSYGGVFQLMTDAITEAKNDPDFEITENYNCWGASIALINNNSLQGDGPEDIFGVGYCLNSLEAFDNALSNKCTPATRETSSVGKTVVRFGTNDSNGHGAVYMGEDRSGNEYVFTKNGWNVRPTIMLTSKMQSENGYGPNCDRSGTLGKGYYNKKTRRRN